MKKKVLITRKLLRSNEEKASKLWDTKLNLNDEVYSQKKLIELSKGFDGILSSLTDKIDEKVINSLPSSIKIVLTDATAEIAMLLILGACRRANEGINYARKENWKWSADFLIGKQLTGSRLGILGMGRIGRALAKLAKSFGMEIHYRNRSRLNPEIEMGAKYHESIKSLFSVSDVLSICCPATKETKDIINKETLEYFPSGAIITNVARGDMIDDEAMIQALVNRKIYAIGLDVYKGEPKIHQGYLNQPTAFILPHLGSATKKTRMAMANLAIDNIDVFFSTGKCKNRIN